jgi:hypothetical protein
MRLIFVYNTNSGTVNAILDSLHKITSPETYNCNLCAITFGKISEDKTWKTFRENSEIEMEFYHKDEFLKQFKSKWLPKYNFPVILSKEKEELQLFISAEELNTFEEVSDLIIEIKKRQFHY